jgi:hypothetical protein
MNTAFVLNVTKVTLYLILSVIKYNRKSVKLKIKLHFLLRIWQSYL